MNFVSVDVEDWYHVNVLEDGEIPPEDPEGQSVVLRGTLRILDLLAEKKTLGTFFVLGKAAERYPDVVREIVSRGHEIASHGYAHRLVYKQTPAEFRDDLLRSIEVLEKHAGKRPIGYRAPSWSITRASEWALDVIAECGFRYDSSIFPTKNFLYGIPDACRTPHVRTFESGRSLHEIPPSTLRVLGKNVPVGGGFFLRSSPLAFSKHALRSLNRDGVPFMLYLHPREMVSDHPRIPTSWSNRLILYLGLHRMERLCAEILESARFGPLGASLAPSA